MHNLWKFLKDIIGYNLDKGLVSKTLTGSGPDADVESILAPPPPPGFVSMS